MADLGESVCPYCGVGCRLRFEGAAGRVTRVRGVETAPANLGGICAKGAQLGPTIATSDRLTRPQLRHEFPFVLTTGRLYTHWHTLTRTGKADKLVLREPGPFVEVHPADAERLGLSEGDLVQISSRRGTVQLPVRLRESVRPGMVFVPFHWGDLYGEGNAANYLTISAIGRVAKQPELKFCAVTLERVHAAPAASVPEEFRARLQRLLASPLAPAGTPAP